ncbi:MAG TPA: TldD/PmbA family protein [Candidatus Kapabacteria bacterium]|nr:TldD/PmbA family protein [Candidatus Kapabacteria bacterium]
MDRRLFLKGALATGALSLGHLDLLAAREAHAAAPRGGPLAKPSQTDQDMVDALLTHAKSLGATYCDIRLVRMRTQSVSARDQVVTGLSDSESYGLGLRVIKNGTWGFAATRDVDLENGKLAAQNAVAMAESNSKLQTIPLDLVPVASVQAEWNTPIQKNPFDISFKDRAQFLLDMHALGASVPIGGNKLTLYSDLNAVREEKYFASTEGSKIWQEITRIDPSTWATVADPVKGEFASRALFVLPQGRGFEYVEQYPYKDEIKQAAADAHEKISAISVKPGKYDLILHPTHLWLTIHETIGHPTELDRIMGYEADFAGTSFLKPDKWKGYGYGSDYMNIVADKTQEGGLATVGFDDDGVPAQSYPLITKGELVATQTTREQAKMAGETSSRGESYAEGWWNIPFQRMPNVSLQPNPKKYSLDDIVKDTGKGILIKGNSSYSIDQQRYNFQFTGQVAFAVEDGKITHMLRDVAYYGKTSNFWDELDALGDQTEYMLGGAMYDGKGEPMQSNPVSHGCPCARFANQRVINTREQSANSKRGMI